MPSQYPSESQLSPRQGGKMVSVAHSPHVHAAKAGRVHEDVNTHRRSKETSNDTGREKKAKQNGDLPHPVVVKTRQPKPRACRTNAASSLPVPLPAPNHSDPPTPTPVVAVQTKAQPTPAATRTVVSGEREGRQSVCPQVALSYTTSILSKRSERVLSYQQSLDYRLQRLHCRARGKQSRGMCRHVQSQIKSAKEEGERREGEDTLMSGHPAAISMQVDGAVEDIDVVRVARSLQFGSCDNIDQSEHVGRNKSANVDIETSANGDDSDQSHDSKLVVDMSPTSLADGVNSSKESSTFQSSKFGNQSDGRSEVLERWRQQLRMVCAGMGGREGESGEGGEVTDSSSDEEGGAEAMDIGQRRLQEVCKNWEHSRGPIGSRWAWLHHHILQINQRLSHLDSAMQRRPKQEPFLLTSPSRSLSPLTHPPSGMWGIGVDRGKVVNGTSHASTSVPHLLLPDGILNGPIQVKDLLSPSPLANNMSFVLEDVGGFTSARTRPLSRRPARKIVKLCRKRSLDLSHTSRPTLPRDVPSWVWLDEGVWQVLREHPYASIPQAKRYHTAANRTRMLALSPSPCSCEVDTESPAKSIGQRKVQQDTCPHSPNLSRSSTPGPLPPFTTSTPSLPYPLTPSLSRKKSRPQSHTPSFDIDNIVIPYSVASATRLEKLEYKEIMTPRWRELKTTPTDHASGSTPTLSDLEDVSDETFRARHEKFERNEKKRFINFISGGQRKRTRPSSLSSTPDPLQHSPWPPAKVRRATFPASPTDPPSSQPVPILSWPPRSFPLQGSDIDALTNPPPPPPLPLPTPRASSSSPSPLLSRPITPSLPPTPSTTSVMVTPLSSPCTPFSENPISPTEWAVNSQIMPTKPCSVAVSGALVLRLTKKT